MITQIEIDGFKTFQNFKIELAPFQVIVGPNGSGKSNFFDALQLLSYLADTDILSAFQKFRSQADELFTQYPGEVVGNKIRLVVELLVDPTGQDDLGVDFTLSYTRLHYKIEIARVNPAEDLKQRFFIFTEELYAIPLSEDNWYQQYNACPGVAARARHPEQRVKFITTWYQPSFFPTSDDLQLLEGRFINLYNAEGLLTRRQFYPSRMKRTVISTINSTEHPYIYALRKELQALQLFHLMPNKLYLPSSISANPVLHSDGSNLPAVLARLKAEDEFAFRGVSMDMTQLVPEILGIDVEEDESRREFSIRAKTADQRSFPVRGLSDGTLRLLALATLRNDPHFHGLLCLEEPENSVQPLYLKKMAQLLYEMATDLNDPDQIGLPLLQVIITTHSPLFISQPHVRDALLLTLMSTHVREKNEPAIRVTRMFPVLKSGAPLPTANGEGKAVAIYTIDTVREYLDSGVLDEARSELDTARSYFQQKDS